MKQYFERRRVTKTFARLVSPSVVDDLLNGKPELRTGQLDARKLDVVLVLVGGLTPGDIAQNISRVTAVAREHDIGHDSITGPLMVFCAGRLPAEKFSREQRLAFVTTLQSRLGNTIKVVHGAGTGHVGLLGSSESLRVYSFLTPHFPEALRVLVSLSDGDAREMPFS